ncbi:MAG: nucleoside phosphorylase [bacterium]
MPHRHIHLKCDPKEVAEYVLLAGDPGRTKMIAENFIKDSRVINEFRGLLSYTGQYEGINVSVVTTGMGCPSAAIVMEELMDMGARYLIRVGTCGATQEGIRPGDIIIPTGAVPLTGIISQYDLKTFAPVPHYRVLNLLVEAAEGLGVSAKTGLVATTDAFYSEMAHGKWWAQRNILAFEMECAAIFTVAYLKKAAAGAILAATGNLLNEEQVIENEITTAAIETECKIALRAVASLAKG